MGYSTDFSGAFDLDKPLTDEHEAYLRAFNKSRRMKRKPLDALNLPDPVREAAGLPIGEEGAYFVGTADQDHGQVGDPSIAEYNSPPKGQPGLWCNWQPTEGGDGIEWDGGEKFYDYTDWLEYLIEHFLGPWGYTLNGSVRWRGEDFDDIGTIVVSGNFVSVEEGVFNGG